MAANLTHELGHSMGMTIFPDFFSPPPGLERPMHVDETDEKGIAGLYYRHPIEKTEIAGDKGIRTPYVRWHCAAGIEDRGKSSDFKNRNGTCVMFGQSLPFSRE